MFPQISDLINYLLGTNISLPFETLGFFVALAFVASYYTFRSEFKRKEKEGLLHPIKTEIVAGEPASVIELAVNGVLGFIGGYKIIGIALNYTEFIKDPGSFIFSFKGNIVAGIICGAAWIYWIYAERKKEEKDTPTIIETWIHPYQLMPRITFICGFWGFIGAKLFNSLENLEFFLADPVGELMSSTGYTYYGGFLFGMLAYFYYCHKHGMKNVNVSDIGATGLMIAYAIGRIGCQLSGDGDWGIVNMNPKPDWLSWLPDWAWSFTYPHNALNKDIYIKGCLGDHCYQLSKGVYPTPLYEALICFLLFAFMWSIRKHVYPGVMACTYLILAGIERFFIEMIRVTPQYHIGNISITQAQLISVGMFIIGIVWLGKIIYANRFKKHSSSISK